MTDIGLKSFTTQQCTMANSSLIWWEYFHNTITDSVALGEAAILALVMQTVIKALQVNWICVNRAMTLSQ